MATVNEVKVVYAEAFLDDQIPLHFQPVIPTTLDLAYKAATALIDSEPILQVPSAKDNRGRIIQWAVNLGFQRVCEGGQWPFDHRWRYFEKPTGRYLENRLSHSVLTISQVVDPKKQPRDVCFRSNKRLNNQGWLPGLPKPNGDENPAGIPHILLTHGHQKLNFAHLGIPNPDHRKDYIFRTGNLLLMPHNVSVDVPPIENTDIDAVMSLKEDMDKLRREIKDGSTPVS